jgi:hypothetical protein
MTSFLDRNTCVCYNTCEGPNFAAFSLFNNFSVFVFDKLLDLYFSVSRVLLRPLGGEIFMTVFITLFYPLSLCDKKGE